MDAGGRPRLEQAVEDARSRPAKAGIQGLFTLFGWRLWCPQQRQSRRADACMDAGGRAASGTKAERDLVMPNERQATPGGAVRDTP